MAIPASVRVTDLIQEHSTTVDPAARFFSYLPRPLMLPSLYSEPYFEWKIAKNPFGRSASFLRSRNGRVVAHCSVTAKPTNAAVLGEARLAELGDAHTHPDYRRQGHFPMLARHAVDAYTKDGGGESLLYGLPNAEALPVWTKFCGCHVFESMRIHEFRGLLAWHSAFRSCRDFLAGEMGAVRLEAASDRGDTIRAIDKVWAEASPSDWLVEKAGPWWAWRYSDSSERYSTYLLRDGEAVLGWVVLKRSFSARLPFRRLAICDIVATTAEHEILGFESVIRRFSSQLSDVTVWAPAGSALAAAASRRGFFVGRDVVVIVAPTDAAHRLLQRPRPPRLSLGDTDNI